MTLQSKYRRLESYCSSPLTVDPNPQPDRNSFSLILRLENTRAAGLNCLYFGRSAGDASRPLHLPSYVGLKLLIKKTYNDGRLALIPDFLTTSWTIDVADSSNREELARKILDADAMVSMNWPTDMPPAPRLRLLHLPGAGTDDIAFESVPAQTTVCNVYEHEIGIAEYILSAMLQWVIGIPRLDAALRRGQW